MSETVETPAADEENVNVSEEAPAEESAESTEENQSSESNDDLPQWARDQLTKANNEAAKYRLAAKEATEKARESVKGEFESQIAELTDAKAALAAELENARVGNMKLQAALSVGIPGESASEFADLLKGETEEDIHAHAEKVKELFGASYKSDPAVDPTRGMGGQIPVDTAPGMARLAYAYGT